MEIPTAVFKLNNLECYKTSIKKDFYFYVELFSTAYTGEFFNTYIAVCCKSE